MQWVDIVSEGSFFDIPMFLQHVCLISILTLMIYYIAVLKQLEYLIDIS